MLLCSNGTVALLCFGSSMLHECGHLLLLACFSGGVRQVTFSAGGVILERESGSFCGRAKECLIALGGVLVNALLCAAGGLRYGKTQSRTAAVLLFVNGALAALNLLPVHALDAYRVLELLFGETNDRLLDRLSLAAVCCFAALCVCLFFCGIRNISLLAVCGYLMHLHRKRSS